jgi:hypothetical protein
MIRLKVQSLKDWFFVLKENNNNRNALGLLVHWWQILHKPNPKPRILRWTYSLKTSFSLAFHISSRSKWMYFVSNHAYSHGWLLLKPFKYETLLSQGLLDYFHVLQYLSTFTCSNIKTSSFDPSLDICDDEITTIKLHIWVLRLLLVISLKKQWNRLENRFTQDFGSRLGLMGVRSLDSSNNPNTKKSTHSCSW